ncbi:MAG TPA: phosphatidate cytidylyltransferase [Rhodospirillales bacterium]|jgi:phosphatidate cytidylyltransferase|nr:phosphatidate cytidylyltransferase [Rhodospirillales bacterium]
MPSSNIRAVIADMALPEGDTQLSPLAARTATACVAAPVVLGFVYFGSPFFEFLIVIMALILAFEWNRLCSGRPLWLALGVIYIAVPCWALLHLRADATAGATNLFWLLAVVWASDTGAYAFGRLIGGAKLAPVISPNKTWAGFLGGIGTAGLTGALTGLILELNEILVIAGLSALIGAISQVGDLGESWVKRHFGVKDTGAILPGHGGLFDRVDGLLVAAVAVAVIGTVGKGNILTWM